MPLCSWVHYLNKEVYEHEPHDCIPNWSKGQIDQLARQLKHVVVVPLVVGLSCGASQLIFLTPPMRPPQTPPPFFFWVEWSISKDRRRLLKSIYKEHKKNPKVKGDTSMKKLIYSRFHKRTHNPTSQHMAKINIKQSTHCLNSQNTTLKDSHSTTRLLKKEAKNILDTSLMAYIFA